MSAVRMCDKCGTIFSENAENWATGEVVVMGKDDRGRPTQIRKVQDQGPCCTDAPATEPRLAIVGAVDRVAATQTQADRDRILDAVAEKP